ncbi:BTAD domain-containing putative transcriptional regulator [Microbacterium yannicii]|uniref:BTAD domain-containing putative transcriptional regulator n=1 Tax=Microbacterium yannicii TaxID=671622 RepID=UPI00178C2437|nr:BTAD domain-containing putative transcriptional regulator [Microbacterium yannicii]
MAALLALLALEPGRVVSAERLMDQLWDDNPPQSGVAALYVYISRLRRQLDAIHISVATRAPGYVLEVAPDAVDTVLFAEAVTAAEVALDEGDLATAERQLRSAREIWRGDPFQGVSACTDLMLESQRLLRVRDRMSELDARLLLAAGQARAAADLARTLTERDPLSEAHWVLRIQAEHDSGNTAVALALYEEVRELLADALGIDPGSRLRALHAQLLREDATHIEAVPPAALHGPAPEHVGIGRVTHLREIDTFLRAAGDRRGGVLVLEGHAGVGKTYLAERAVDIAERAGFATTWTRTVEGMGTPPLWPWQRILASLPDATDPTGAHELAELQLTLGASSDADEARFRLSEALVSRVLTAARQRPLLLVFDDVQWADAATLHAIGMLASVVRSSACLVVLTVRQPVAHRPALASTLASLQRETTTHRLHVAEFTVAEITAELQRTAELTDDEASEAAAQLQERTGGNAFFLTELLADSSSDALPATVADLVEERLAPLPSSLRQLVDIAAIAGLEIDTPLLATALGLTPDDVLSQADEVCAVGLWRQDATGYAFAHSLARDAVLASIPRATAADAHRLLADALEQRHVADLDPVLEALAYHRFRAAAGMSDEQAYLVCTAAADRAARSLAFDQAATFRERALSSTPAGDLQPRRRAETLLSLTAERRAAGDVVAAASSLRQAIRAAQQLGDAGFTVRVLALLGEVTLWNWRQYGEVDTDTIAVLDDLLSHASLTDAERTDLSVALAMELYYADEPVRSRAAMLTGAAVATASTGTDDVRRSRAYSASVFSVWRPNSEQARLTVLNDWLSGTSTAGTMHGEVVARLHRASIHLVHGDIDAWSVDIERAGDLLTRAGRAEYAAQYTAQLAGAALQAGRLDEARDLIARTDATMRRTSMWGGSWVTWIQRLTLARVQGNVADIADELLAAAAPDGQRSLRSAAVLALAEAGRLDEARAMQGRWNLRLMPRTSTWSTDFDVAQAAEVAVHLGTPLLSDAYDHLARSTSPLLMAGTGIAILGPRDELLARIAVRLGRHDDARAHHAQARLLTDDIRSALGAPPAWPLTPVA